MSFKLGEPVADEDGDIFFVCETNYQGDLDTYLVGTLVNGSLRHKGYAHVSELHRPKPKEWRKYLYL
jgi:hypothetical protein